MSDFMMAQETITVELKGPGGETKEKSRVVITRPLKSGAKKKDAISESRGPLKIAFGREVLAHESSADGEQSHSHLPSPEGDASCWNGKY